MTRHKSTKMTQSFIKISLTNILKMLKRYYLEPFLSKQTDSSYLRLLDKHSLTETWLG